MKVLHVNTYDTGGAANACIRLHLGLTKTKNIQSKLLVRDKRRDIENTYKFDFQRSNRVLRMLRRFSFELGFISNPNKTKRDIEKEIITSKHFSDVEIFSFADTNIDITQSSFYQDADIIHLHWVANFLDYQSFFKKNKKPIVWTLHDMAPFMGGLHYEKLIEGIDGLGYPVFRELTVKQRTLIDLGLKEKFNSLVNVDSISVVAPSKWLKDLSEKSVLLSKFKHHLIRYGIDTTVFKLHNQLFSRKVFGLPISKKILLFVADSVSNNRKGFRFLHEAISELKKDDLLICTVGSTLMTFGEVPTVHLGKIVDERLMSLLYSAADAFIIPSLEDNLPNTMLESLVCGTPVIGFPVGGIAEIIEDGVNGYLCSDVSLGSLINSIERYLSNPSIFDRENISIQAQKLFDLETQAINYQLLYKAILKNGL